MNFLRRYRVEAILFCLAFFVRALYAVIIQQLFGTDVFVSYSDATVYVKLANNIIHHHIFSEALLYPHLVPDAMRTPGYPAFLALFQFMKAPFFVTVLIQDMLAGGLTVLLYSFASNVFQQKKVGMITAVVFALDPAMMYWTNLLMSDHFAGVFFALAIFLFAKKRFGWAGAAFGIAALTRPVFFYLFPLLPAMILYQNRKIFLEYLRHGRSLFAVFKPVLLITIFFALMVVPWMGRNYAQFGQWSLSSNGWMAIHFFISRPFSEAHNISFSWPVAPESYYNFPGVEKLTKPNKNTYYRYEFFNHPFYKKHFADMVREYPLEYAVFHLGSSAKGFFKADYDYLMNHVLLPEIPQIPKAATNAFQFFYFSIWYSLCLLAISVVFYKKYRAWAVFLLSFPLLNVLLIGPISAGLGAGRYNLQFFPFFVLLGVLGGCLLSQRLKKNILSYVR